MYYYTTHALLYDYMLYDMLYGTDYTMMYYAVYVLCATRPRAWQVCRHPCYTMCYVRGVQYTVQYSTLYATPLHACALYIHDSPAHYYTRR